MPILGQHASPLPANASTNWTHSVISHKLWDILPTTTSEHAQLEPEQQRCTLLQPPPFPLMPGLECREVVAKSELQNYFSHNFYSLSINPYFCTPYLLNLSKENFPAFSKPLAYNCFVSTHSLYMLIHSIQLVRFTLFTNCINQLTIILLHISKI
uniref:Uncharacterized protein n=1 Tax=Meloidogyne enterolobii TaxID=390850 RepID=A0A6V7WZU4_MELEN|nr:unnamed protein product [Meloidogyne enterolobii]